LNPAGPAVAKRFQLAASIAVLLVCLGLLSAALYQNAANRDFISYWTSAQLLRAHANPYAHDAVLRAEHQAGMKYSEPLIMRNPPWALFVVIPLGFFSAPTASFLWLLVLITAALLSIKCLRMGCRPPPLVVYLFAPILGCAMAGQTSIFLLAGIAFFLKYQERLPYLSGVARLAGLSGWDARGANRSAILTESVFSPAHHDARTSGWDAGGSVDSGAAVVLPVLLATA